MSPGSVRSIVPRERSDRIVRSRRSLACSSHRGKFSSSCGMVFDTIDRCGSQQLPPTREPDEFEAVRSRLATRIAGWTAGVERFATAIPSLTLYRHDAPTEAMSCMVEPAIALTVQGAKRAILRDDVYAYNKHRFLLTTLDLPVVLQAVEASKDTPYLSLVLRLDERVIAELVMQSAVQPLARQPSHTRGIAIGQTSTRMLETFDRLVQLLDEPEAIDVVAPLVQKEIFFRLLVGEQGALLWQLAAVGRPRPPRGSGDRLVEVELRAAAARREARPTRADEPFAVSPPLPTTHGHEPIAVSEAPPAE